MNSYHPRAVKAGYPPHPLTLVPELPIDSLGLKQGEQLVVVQRAAPSHQSSSSSRGTTTSVLPAPSPAAAMTGLTASQVREPARLTAKAGAKGGGLDYIPTSHGYLIHRVSLCPFLAVDPYGVVGGVEDGTMI